MSKFEVYLVRLETPLVEIVVTVVESSAKEALAGAIGHANVLKDVSITDKNLTDFSVSLCDLEHSYIIESHIKCRSLEKS